MEGWIKIERSIEENPTVTRDNEYFRVWLHLLLNASHKVRKSILGKEEVVILPGQLVTGRKKIADACGVSPSKVERILENFEVTEMITQRKTTKNRLISILNWSLYQGEVDSKNRTTDWTTDGQQIEQQKNLAKADVPMVSENGNGKSGQQNGQQMDNTLDSNRTTSGHIQECKNENINKPIDLYMAHPGKRPIILNGKRMWIR